MRNHDYFSQNESSPSYNYIYLLRFYCSKLEYLMNFLENDQ